MAEFHTLEDAFSYVRVLQKPIVIPETKQKWKSKTRERVDGGDPVRTPIDRVAARVVAPAPWWAMPPQTTKKAETKKAETKTKKNRNKKMKQAYDIVTNKGDIDIPNQTSTTASGLKIYRVNGEDMFKMEDIAAMICAEIAKLPKETRPNVKAAEDARRIIDELMQGIGGDMEKFRADSKRYLEDIRNVRFAIVTETSQMTGALKEVRQFFLGGDYREEINRLKEFVDLCERLQKLKECGFLDNVADTMLKLAN